jgi:predicted nucleic acid-binding protein
MIASGERVFVDTGAWVALAVVRDPYHDRARRAWEALGRAGARIVTSVPVTLETFTFLDRRGSRELALAWWRSLEAIPRFEVLDCTPEDVREAMRCFDRKELHKLSLTDATSFVLMRKRKIRTAFAFDVLFAVAGYRCVA